jgi:hypothetical protein
LLDAARVLLAEGIAADTLIEMRHAGADHVALRAKVMAAAKLRVLEGQRDTIRFARWSAFEGWPSPFGSGQLVLGPTDTRKNAMFNGRRQPSCDGTSRMTRECQVRICERLGVKFPGPTRRCCRKKSLI